MAEVGVAFPDSEATAEVMASRLRAAGIASRVDRGLWGGWQVGQRGQITLLVDPRDAKRAVAVLGPTRAAGGLPPAVLRAAIVVVALLILFGVVVLVGSRIL